jgi:hypothetical protein
MNSKNALLTLAFVAVLAIVVLPATALSAEEDKEVRLLLSDSDETSIYADGAIHQRDVVLTYPLHEVETNEHSYVYDAFLILIIILATLGLLHVKAKGMKFKMPGKK